MAHFEELGVENFMYLMTLMRNCIPIFFIKAYAVGTEFEFVEAIQMSSYNVHYLASFHFGSF